MSTPTEPPTTKTIYVTRSGLPLSFKLAWPFQHATSGADFEVLHAVITLENSEDLRALVAVNLSATLREALASLEPQDTEGPIINALRKEVDCRQTEFLKSGKLVPLALSSRHYNFRLKKWTFGKAGEEEIARGMAAGVDEYQIKLNKDELTQSIRKAVRRNSGGAPKEKCFSGRTGESG